MRSITPPLINVNNFENLFTILIYKELQPISNSPKKVNSNTTQQNVHITTSEIAISSLATNKKYAQRKAILLYAYLFLSYILFFDAILPSQKVFPANSSMLLRPSSSCLQLVATHYLCRCVID